MELVMFLLLCTLLALVSCESNNAGKQYHGTTDKWSEVSLITNTKSPWVHLVYMIADNNLDSYGVSDLEEMRLNNATTDELSLIVYVDRCFGCDDDESTMVPVNEIYDYYTNEPVNGQFNGSKILQKAYNTDSNAHIWYQMYDFGHELDSTLEENIGNFTQLLSQFESNSYVEYYALTFWDHGGAWSGYGSDDNTANSTGLEANTLERLFDAVSSGLQETFIGRLDLLGFDACIMADYSVLNAMSGDIAQYYLASEVSEPGEGWDYTGLSPMNSNNSGIVSTPVEYAVYIIDSYVYQTDKITTQDYGAGYTLALFDMDKIESFLNEFDAFVRMMTLPVSNYDYGMLMSILRGRSESIASEEDFYIYDLGLFLDGLVENIFFNTCPTRFINVGTNVLQYWDDALLYFNADFLRSDLTGASIFFATNASTLDLFTYYNSDLDSDNYVLFLEAVSNSLKLLQTPNGASLLSNDTCHMPIPSNLTFYLSNINIDHNSEYDLYKIRADCGQTVMSASTEVYLHIEYSNATNIDIGIASVETDINDVSLTETQLEMFWDGKIAFFKDNYNKSNENISVILSTSTIEYYFKSDNSEVPIGYTIEFPVKLYDMSSVTDSKTGEISIPLGSDGLYSGNNASSGYLQVSVLINPSNGTWTDRDTTATMTLFEIDEDWGVIGEVSENSKRVILGDSSYMINTNITSSHDYYGNSYLVWPNISISFVDLWADKGASSGLETAVIMEATDVLGNGIAEYIVVENDTVYSTWMPSNDNTNAADMTTTDVASSSGNDGNSSKKTGLDAVSGAVWLAIVLVLAFVLIVVAVMFCRERSLRSDIAMNKGNSGYLNMP